MAYYIFSLVSMRLMNFILVSQFTHIWGIKHVGSEDMRPAAVV